MTYEEIVGKALIVYAKADAKEITGHLAIQFNVRGEGEGAFYLEVSEGKVDIQPYEYYDNKAKFIATAQVFKDIANGKIDPVKAFLKGKLDVKGDLGKAGELRKLIKNKK